MASLIKISNFEFYITKKDLKQMTSKMVELNKEYLEMKDKIVEHVGLDRYWIQYIVCYSRFMYYIISQKCLFVFKKVQNGKSQLNSQDVETLRNNITKVYDRLIKKYKNQLQVYIDSLDLIVGQTDQLEKYFTKQNQEHDLFVITSFLKILQKQN